MSTTGNDSASLPAKSSRSWSLATRDGADSGSTRSSGLAKRAFRNGRPRRISTADDRGAHDDRTSHHSAGRAVPESLLTGAAGRAPGTPAGGRCRVPTTANRAGRVTIDADHRQQHDGDPGVGERPQEVEREDEERTERHGDGQRADQHGASGGLDGADHGVVHRASGAQLLPVAGHDEQAVVDGQAEAESGGQVDGVDRHVGDRPDDEQGEERAQHGDDADEQRQRRGDQSAEHEQQQHQRDRDGDHLGAHEVALDRRTDVDPDGIGPADGHRRSRAVPVPRSRAAPRSRPLRPRRRPPR